MTFPEHLQYIYKENRTETDVLDVLKVTVWIQQAAPPVLIWHAWLRVDLHCVFYDDITVLKSSYHKMELVQSALT